jgi:hypothetical protein
MISCNYHVFSTFPRSKNISAIFRGVGRHRKFPFSGGKVPFAFVKNVFQIAFLTHRCCKAISVSFCSYLSVGQLNNEMTSLLPAHSLAENRAFQNQKSGWSTTNRKICTVLFCKNNCKLLSFFLSLSLDLIRELASTAFDYDCIYSFPTPPPSPTFLGKFF